MPRPLPWPVTETDASLSARLSGAVVWSSRLTRWQQSPCDKAEAARTYYLLNHSATARRTEIRTRNEDVRVIRRVTARSSVLLVLSTSISNILAIRLAAADPPSGAARAAGLDRAEHERLEGRAVHAALLVQPVGYKRNETPNNPYTQDAGAVGIGSRRRPGWSEGGDRGRCRSRGGGLCTWNESTVHTPLTATAFPLRAHHPSPPSRPSSLKPTPAPCAPPTLSMTRHRFKRPVCMGTRRWWTRSSRPVPISIRRTRYVE